MSGAEAILVLGVISSVISIVDAAQKVYKAAGDANGLSPAFKEVAERLPLVKDTLQATQKDINSGHVDEDTCKDMKAVVKACETKSKALEAIFQKVFPKPNASRMEHYVKALRGLPKGSRVELLMEGILIDIQLLASNRGMRTVTGAEMDKLTEAIREIRSLEPSADDNLGGDTSISNVHHGTGDINSATGDLYTNPGSGNFYKADTQNFGGTGKN
jgi:hypothetical protein